MDTIDESNTPVYVITPAPNTKPASSSTRNKTVADRPSNSNTETATETTRQSINSQAPTDITERSGFSNKYKMS